ncbi:Polypeptide N-acetylgalactosaminyltransferase 3 [Pseudolycoriella hygida]|uniref:Polypeptide N-acetylgalactosaminyltransferase n=1 Tax=Pseudolycoriella hygida TaxID=35572 RepID=A0A9Q0NEF6_9DIPT|nr:Polypeptide N-acetylgalactosaminyltransferase 3 [Pseudolycoriella hygida]
MWMRCLKIRKKSIAFIFVGFCASLLFYLMLLRLAELIISRSRSSELSHSKRSHRKTIQNSNVVVAHYIGSGNLFGNVSIEALNRNDFSPINGEGDDGKPVIIPAKDVLRMQQKFQINRFNLMASDRMALNRTLPDVRKKKCIDKKYPLDLPTTSIIIVFHNEAWSVLMRTVWSVINRSPKNLLKEILLVDDASDREFLKNSLDAYVGKLPVKTIVLRQSVREGLVAARLLGAKHATGDDVTERQLLRKNLKCHNFEWYLTNIWQNHFFPTKDRFFGKLMLTDVNSEQYYEYLNCLQDFDLLQYDNWPYVIDYFNQRVEQFSRVLKIRNGFCVHKPNTPGVSNVPYGQARLGACGNETHVEDFFVITDDGHIMTNEGICIDAVEKTSIETKSSLIRIVTCAESNRQKWIYDVRTQQIVQGTSNFCLTADESVAKNLEDFGRNAGESFNVTLSKCHESNLQKWILFPFAWKNS